MTAAQVNLLAALISLAASLVWLLLGDAPSGLLWFGVSLVWFLIGVLTLNRKEPDAHPVRTLARKLSRLLLFG